MEKKNKKIEMINKYNLHFWKTDFFFSPNFKINKAYAMSLSTVFQVVVSIVKLWYKNHPELSRNLIPWSGASRFYKIIVLRGGEY